MFYCYVCNNERWVDLLLGQSEYQKIMISCPNCCYYPPKTLKEVVLEHGLEWPFL